MTLEASYGLGPGEPNLVSVIIPTYQRARSLVRAIESALAQTHQPVEIIVVDDGSTDDTRQTVENFGSRVRYVYQANAGVSAARNLGLKHAQGEFIAFLDSDDTWLPWKLAAQLQVLRKHPEVGMVWTDMSAVDESGTMRAMTYLRTYYRAYTKVRLDEIFARTGLISEICTNVEPEVAAHRFYIGNIFASMLLGNLVHTSTVVLRRERQRQVGGFDMSKRTCEDYEFHLKTCSYGPVALLDVPSIHYQVGAEDRLSGPRMNLQIARNDLRTLQAGLQQAGKQNPLPRCVVNHRLAESHGWLGLEELKVGNHREARRQFGKSLYYRPRQPGTAALALLSLLPPSASRAVHRGWQAVKAFPSLGYARNK